MTDIELEKNELFAERYYQDLHSAVERRDWDVMMNLDPPSHTRNQGEELIEPLGEMF